MANYDLLEQDLEQELESNVGLFDCLTQKGTPTSDFFTSMSIETEEQKAATFNILSGESHRLRDNVHKQIQVEHLLYHTVELLNENTGELVQAPRIIFVGNNTAYTCVSMGVLSALKRVFQIYGTPPWTPPLIIEPVEISGKNSTNRILTLKLHPRKL